MLHPELPPLPVELVPDAPFDVEEVEGALAGGAPEVVERVSAWRPADDGHAEWLARLLASARDESAAIAGQAAAWRAPIDEWESSRMESPQRVIAWAEALLSDYAIAERRAGGRSTIALPSARLATREQNKGGSAVVVDEAAVIAWAEANLDGDDLAAVVKVTKKVLVGGLRKATVVVERFARDDQDRTLVDDDGDPVVELVVLDPTTGDTVPGTEVAGPYFSPSVR